jgi:GxxExxY protein
MRGHIGKASMEINSITGIIIEESIELHRDLGPGLLESVYEAILAKRIRDRGLAVACQVSVPLIYHGQEFPVGFRLDMLVEERVVVELKSVELLPAVSFKKLNTY